MSLLPIATPRTADILTQLRLVRQLNSDNQTLEGLYTQLSTGRRVNTLSDDPASAISAISLQASKEYSDQMLRNADSAEGYLNVTDTASSDIHNALNEAQGTILLAAQTPLSDAERGAYAEELERITDRIVTASNATYRGHYVLGGAIDKQAPLSREGVAIVWSGQPSLQSTRISREWLLETGIQANQALGVGATIGKSDDLDVAVTTATSLTDIYAGQGITPGVIRLGAGQNRYDVDLRDAKTIGDLQDALQSIDLDGRSLQVDISPEGISIDYADGLGGTLSIDDVGEGKTAESLGIRNPLGFSGLPLTSHSLDPTLSPLVELADLAGGAGLDLSAGLKIKQGDATFVVDLSQATTIEDVVVAINLSGADVRASLSPASGQLEVVGLANGVDYSISENGGNAAELLGLRTATANTTLAELNRGLGVDMATGADFTITRTDGSTLEIDLEGANTIADVLDRINNHVDNVGPAVVTASLRSDANGINWQAPSEPRYYPSPSQTAATRRSRWESFPEA
ncbi:MAG: flagellin hook IN motif-containing protein [Pirellulaceae bacterium]